MTSIQQREQLQSKIWKIANEVRGAVDGCVFRQIKRTPKIFLRGKILGVILHLR